MTLIGTALIGASLAIWGATGCGKKEASCDAVFEHVKDLAPAEMKDFEGSKSDALAKCETLTVEQRKCILDAGDLAAVAVCKNK